MTPLHWLLVGNLLGLLVLAGFFHALAWMSRRGGERSAARGLLEMCCRAPLLDVVVFVLTMGPMVSAGVVWVAEGGNSASRLGLYVLAALVAQGAALIIWSKLHVWAHPEVRKGPRIVKSLNRAVGPVRNHVAVWWTATAVPVFTIIRITEYIVYPPLTWLIRLPKYKAGDWVNISRQKFTGLVGYDLIWCLYCDWMTGIWSLGSEILRNIESFWCPIRYSSPEKCANCVREFPDIDGGWAKETTDIAEAARVVESKYPGPGGVNAWFGHPVRLTREGKGAGEKKD